jgi:hypothetical protein
VLSSQFPGPSRSAAPHFAASSRAFSKLASSKPGLCLATVGHAGEVEDVDEPVAGTRVVDSRKVLGVKEAAGCDELLEDIASSARPFMVYSVLCAQDASMHHAI